LSKSLKKKYLPFRFKQFTVEQTAAAMKIGTDGILLGAWSIQNFKEKKTCNNNNNKLKALDIGTGTGVIALMIAQELPHLYIDAIEIEPLAAKEATTNFLASNWKDRLSCHKTSFQDFSKNNPTTKYALICSNPPFFSEKTQKSNSSVRNTARFLDTLPLNELFMGVINCLCPQKGIFHIIVPYEIEQKCIEIAEQLLLFPEKITRVRGTKDSAIKRSLICFSFYKVSILKEELILEISRHQYTPEYIKLVKDFYLKL